MGIVKKQPRKIDFKTLQNKQPCVYILENIRVNGVISPLQKFSFNYKKDKNNIDTAILEKTSEGTHIKIITKNSKDIIIIQNIYKNAFKIPKEKRAEIFKSNYKNKSKGYELYNIKANVHTYNNLKPNLVFILDGLTYVNYYKIDGKMNDSYNLIAETIGGTSPKG